MVTAELAVVLPALVLIMMTGLYAVAAVSAQLRCTAAAATAARLAARGEPSSVVSSAATAGAPGGAQIAISTGQTVVTATVTARLRPAGLPLPGVTVRARVVAAREPTP